MPQKSPLLRNGAPGEDPLGHMVGPAKVDLEVGPGMGAGRWRGGTVPPLSSAIRILCAVLLVALLALITVVSLQPGTGAVPLFPHIDKLEHFAAYFAVAGLALPAFRNVLFAFALAALWGVGVEVLQDVVATGRDASVSDAIANSLGALSGVWASRSVLRRLFP